MTAPSKSLLSSKLAGVASPGSPAASVSALRRTIVAGRRGAYRELPAFGRVWIEIPGARTWQDIETAVRRKMIDEVGELSVLTAAQWEAERALRIVAEAVRDPNDHAIPFGPLEEWETLDNDLISPAWLAFGDVRDELDPLATPLTPEENLAIDVAIKKKEAPSLRSFGVMKLCAYLLTTGARQSISAPPSSPSSESSSES